MGIYHNLILRRFLQRINVMVHHPLAVMVLTTRNNITYIATLYRIITMVRHKLIGLIHVPLIIAYRTGSLVVHHHTHHYRSRIGVEHYHVKIGIGRHKIKDILLRLTKPTLPAYIPTCYQYGIKAMLSGK